MQSKMAIGIAGGSGAGKTVLANAVAERLADEAPVALVRTDWYYCDLAHLEPAQRDGTNFDDPASIDWGVLLAQVRELRAGGSISRPSYNFATHTRGPSPGRLGPVEIVVVEGVFALANSELRSLLDLLVYVEASEHGRFERRLQRDVRQRGRTVESVKRQFRETVAPMHEKFIEPQREFAHLTVDGEGSLSAAVERVLRPSRADPG